MSVRSRVHQSRRRSPIVEGSRAARRARVVGRSSNAAAGWIGSVLCFGLMVACASPDESELFDPVPKTEASGTNPSPAMGTEDEVTFDAEGVVSDVAGSEGQGGGLALPGEGGEANGGDETLGASTSLDPDGAADAGSSQEPATEDAGAPCFGFEFAGFGYRLCPSGGNIGLP
jgi:hypothetical protein